MDFGRHLLIRKSIKRSVETLIYIERRLESQSFIALRRSLLPTNIKQPKTPKLRLKSCKQLIVRLKLL